MATEGQSASSSTSTTPKMSVQNIKTSVTASWNCHKRGHSIMTPYLGIVISNRVNDGSLVSSFLLYLLLFYFCCSSIQLVFWGKLVQQRRTYVMSFCMQFEQWGRGLLGEAFQCEGELAGGWRREGEKRETACKMTSLLAYVVSVKKQLYTTAVNKNDLRFFNFIFSGIISNINLHFD